MTRPLTPWRAEPAAAGAVATDVRAVITATVATSPRTPPRLGLPATCTAGPPGGDQPVGAPQGPVADQCPAEAPAPVRDRRVAALDRTGNALQDPREGPAARQQAQQRGGRAPARG